jgi:hypothetical protein
MSKEGMHKTLRFWQWVEVEIDRLKAIGADGITDESLRIMKRINRQLRILILIVELAVIDRKKEKGRLTPKQARSEKAKLKKKWL